MITATDAGGPLDVVHDGSTGRVVDPEPARSRPPRSGCATIRSRRWRSGGPGKAIADEVTWDRVDRAAALVKVAIFSPMPPERSGIADYSALLLPALRARCEVVVVKRGAKRPPRGTDLCVYHIGNNPDAHGWIVEALRRTPGVVVLHDFVLHHLVAGLTIGRRDGHGYLDAMEREGGVVGRLLGHAVLDKRIPPLWENRPRGLPSRRRGARPRDRADRPLPLRPRPRPRRRLRRARSGSSRIPAFPVPTVPAVEIAGDPLFGTFGNVNASKRVPQLLEAFARVRRERARRGLLLVGATSPGFDLDRRLAAARARRRRARARGLRRRGAGSGG